MRTECRQGEDLIDPDISDATFSRLDDPDRHVLKRSTSSISK
jgi:hypothetical protein